MARKGIGVVGSKNACTACAILGDGAVTMLEHENTFEERHASLAGHGEWALRSRSEIWDLVAESRKALAHSQQLIFEVEAALPISSVWSAARAKPREPLTTHTRDERLLPFPSIRDPHTDGDGARPAGARSSQSSEVIFLRLGLRGLPNAGNRQVLLLAPELGARAEEVLARAETFVDAYAQGMMRNIAVRHEKLATLPVSVCRRSSDTHGMACLTGEVLKNRLRQS